MKRITSIVLVNLLLCVTSASAQWLRIQDIPESVSVPSFYSDGNIVYAGANGVVYKTTNGGENWISSNQINSNVDFISAVIKHNNRIFAGTYNYGVFESTNDGESWIERNTGLTSRAAKTISDLVIRGNKLYASTIGAGIYVFDLESSGSWQPFNNGIPSNLSFNVNSLILIDQTIYAGAGGNGFYYKNDPGSNVWTEHQFGIITGEPLSFYDMVIKGNAQFIVSSYGLFKSTDAGNSWNFVNTGSGYLATGNFIFAGNDLFVAMTKPSRTIWFKYNDNDDTWNFFNEVLGANTLNAIYVNGKIFDGRLYGLWYLPLNPSEGPGNEVPVDFQLFQNYPNPFNPVTTIKFSVPETSRVKLEVFNVIGELVTTLLDTELPAGVKEITFNASNFSSGVYYYSISTQNFTSVKKMILVK